MRLGRTDKNTRGSALWFANRMVLTASIAALTSVGALGLEWDADSSTPGIQGGSGVWNAGNSWWDGSQNVPWVNGDPAVFGGAPGTVDIDLSFLQMSSLTFTSNYKLVQKTQSPLWVHGAITVADGVEAEIESFLNGALTKEGNGTLKLLWPSSGSGPTIINAGTLIGGSGSVSLTIAAGATYKLTDGNPSVGGVPALFGSGTIDIRAHSLIVMNSPNGQNAPSLFAGAITGAGGVTFQNAGTYSGMSSSFTGGATIAAQVSVPTITDKGVNGPLGAGETITFSEGGVLTISGTGQASSDRAVMLGAAAAIAVSSPTGEVTLEGAITGSGSLSKTGSGALVLSGSNTYQGATNIILGTLVASGGSAIPDGSNVTISGGRLRLLDDEAIWLLSGQGSVDLGGNTLTLNGLGSSNFSGRITGSGGVVVKGAELNVSGDSDFSGGITIAGGSVTVSKLSNIGVNSPLGSDGPVILGDEARAGGLRVIEFYGGNFSTNRPLSINAGGGFIEVGGSKTNLSFSGPVEGNGSLAYRGVGRLSLVGDKAFSGTIIAERGVLDLGGSMPASAIVQNGATLITSGPDARSLNALTLTGGTLALGGNGAVGALNSSKLTLNSGVLEFDLEGSRNDHFSVTGEVILAGPISLSLSLAVDPEDFVDVYRLVLNDGTDITTLFDEASRFVYQGNILEEGETFLVTSGSISQYFQMHYGLTPEDNDIRIVAAPEPGSALLLATGAVGLLGLRRRRP